MSHFKLKYNKLDSWRQSVCLCLRWSLTLMDRCDGSLRVSVIAGFVQI